MKTISQATLKGFVTRAAAERGSIEISGLSVFLEKGVVVQAHDFVELEMTLDESGFWRGSITCHLNNPLNSSAASGVAQERVAEQRVHESTAVATMSPTPVPADTPSKAPAPAAQGAVVRSFTRGSTTASAASASPAHQRPQTHPSPVAAPSPAAAPEAPRSGNTANRADRFRSRPHPAANQQPAARTSAHQTSAQSSTRPVFAETSDEDDDVPF